MSRHLKYLTCATYGWRPTIQLDNILQFYLIQLSLYFLKLIEIMTMEYNTMREVGIYVCFHGLYDYICLVYLF